MNKLNLKKVPAYQFSSKGVTANTKRKAEFEIFLSISEIFYL
jgi:hypothetical protein